MPIKRGRFWVPPAPGIIPSVTSAARDRLLVGDPDVAGHRELGTAAEAGAVDRPRSPAAAACPMASCIACDAEDVALCAIAVERHEVLDVAAGHEMLARAREDEAADVRVFAARSSTCSWIARATSGCSALTGGLSIVRTAIGAAPLECGSQSPIDSPPQIDQASGR